MVSHPCLVVLESRTGEAFLFFTKPHVCTPLPIPSHTRLFLPPAASIASLSRFVERTPCASPGVFAAGTCLARHAPGLRLFLRLVAVLEVVVAP
eukprot:scaffold2697_cov346-Pavlova_lutheri.AAC.2